MNIHLNRATVLVAAGAMVLAVAGCGSDDDDDGQAAEAAAQPSRLAIELGGTKKSPSFTVPKSVKGGTVRIEFKNSLEGEHSAQIVSAEDGHTPHEALKAGNAWGNGGKPLPDWVVLAGGLGDVPQGETASVTQELAPGSYLVADLSSGASATFEVTPGSDGAEAPAPAATIKATEYSFETDGLEAGRNEVLFDNAGGEPHFVAAVGLKDGKTIDEARRFFQTEKGAPPFDESRSFSTALVDGGQSQSVDLDLEAGRYVLLCWVPDRKGGPPHVAKGMISEVTVD
jgi:plastocyanin